MLSSEKTKIDNPTLTSITISTQDVEKYAREVGLSEEEIDYLVDNLHTIADQVIDFIQATGWRHYFHEACSAYITGLRLEEKTYVSSNSAANTDSIN